MLEKFRESFNFDANGVLRNWKIYDDKTINQKFSQSVKIFENTNKFLKKSLIMDYDGDVMFKTEETHKIIQKFKKGINDILEQAFNKKYNRNTL